MRLIFLYGPPAVGKLTVAKELAKHTGFTLVHNHLILNALSEIFGYDNPIRRKLEKEFRLRIIEELINSNINIIMTGVIATNNKDFYDEVIDLIKNSNNDVTIVHLIASEESLLQRVSHVSRKELKKIENSERWKEFVNEYPEIFDTSFFDNEILIDTTHLSIEETVNTILTKARLA